MCACESLKLGFGRRFNRSIRWCMARGSIHPPDPPPPACLASTNRGTGGAAGAWCRTSPWCRRRGASPVPAGISKGDVDRGVDIGPSKGKAGKGEMANPSLHHRHPLAANSFLHSSVRSHTNTHTPTKPKTRRTCGMTSRSRAKSNAILAQLSALPAPARARRRTLWGCFFWRCVGVCVCVGVCGMSCLDARDQV